ncbi:hypothetical protein ILUMI_08335 [Ignelater luminosus]|uniref:Uncharacterized protein n=1 Tax=Ignelater luminosus TaxID=2038154 RepID=A0A8K0GAR3_IGNLU|nr:hypothetical protein ILUMI_08335 [Ignelater luminosus]
MVWMDISWNGKEKLYSVPQGVKIKAEDYTEDILVPIVKPLNTFISRARRLHETKMIQSCVKEKLSNFIAREDCPSASPDLNLQNYDLWSKLRLDVCSKPHTSLESPKQSLVKKWETFVQGKARTAIEA